MSQQNSVNLELVLKQFRERVLAAPDSKRVKSLFKDECPKIRTRTSGPVGPELDYSIRFARIHQDNWNRGGGLKWAQNELISTAVTYYRDMSVFAAGGRDIHAGRSTKFALHNHVELISLSDKGVEAWTEYAMSRNLQFDGEYGYRKIGRRTQVKLAKAAFKAAKESGEVPSGKRSRDAALRRASIRRSRRSDPVWVGSRSLPIEVKEPMVRRRMQAASFLRKDWRKNFSGVRWTEYCDSYAHVEHCISLPFGKPLPLSGPVRLAIERIYSKCEYVKVPNFNWTKPAQGWKWRVPEPEVVSSSPIIARPRGQARRLFTANNINYVSFLGGQTIIAPNG